MTTKVGTIQQNKNVIDGVNLGAGVTLLIYTQTMQSTDIISMSIKGGGGGGGGLLTKNGYYQMTKYCYYLNLEAKQKCEP